MRKKMGAVRRAELARATFETLQQSGLRNTTVAQVSRRAGLAPGLVHHYFKSKSEMVEAAIRLASTEISREAVIRLRSARSPRERLDAVIDANLAPSVFTQPVTQAWMAFGVEATHDERQRRVLNVIEQRLKSNLRHCLIGLVAPENVDAIAAGVRMMINGAWQECALSEAPANADTVRACIRDYVDARLAALAHPAMRP
jgi:betaine-aldehyde dehydrogenase